MRIAIREQLATLILLASVIGLAVVSIATWVTVHDFVLSLRTNRLGIYASLKASQITSNMALMQNSVQFVGSRVLIQAALQQYNDFDNNSASNWAGAQSDLESAIGGEASGAAQGAALLLQACIYPRKANGQSGSAPVLNATSGEVLGRIKLPYFHPDGSDVYLGDPGLGYPPNLYPNFTFTDVQTSSGPEAGAVYDGALLSPAKSQASDVLVLGPWPINETLAVMSITIPIINNTSSTDALGWLTVVLDSRLLENVISSTEGLDHTGAMLLIRPTNVTNQFPPHVLYTNDPINNIVDDQQVQFVLPLVLNDSARNHGRTVVGTSNPPFNITQYTKLPDVYSVDMNAVNNAFGDIYSTNEVGVPISAGFARVAVPYVDWAVIVEESRAEVWGPINNLRNVILACVFATIGGLCIIVWPMAHFASKPIRQLRAATLKSVMPPGYEDSVESFRSASDAGEDGTDGVNDTRESRELARKEGFVGKLAFWQKGKKKPRAQREEEARRQQFRIPGKVEERKHLIKDELSDLTRTFNEMSDELMMQYERLEERVRQRTSELEASKKAAEAANESKTLFIANISHELKTPLNGILGMCAVCMQEDDPTRLKRSLGIIYKSGDLLLNLLTDLLTFSKNQVGQQLSLDEKDFRLRDVSSQIQAIFEKQANEGQIDLRIQFEGGTGDQVREGSLERSSAQIPGIGRLKDMVLWGDTHRILQVVINLVSNSLKFTPPGGKVVLTIRCLGDAPAETSSRKTSIGSKASKKPSNRQRHSDASLVHGRSLTSSLDQEKSAFARVMEVERVAAPPGRSLLFEFEVVDTGPGIPEDLHQRIFEPFVQGDLGLSKKYGGTGLGLSICSQLADLMQGSMHLESQVGVGSKFTMRIPLRLLMTRADSTASSSIDLSLETGVSDVPSTPDRGSRANMGSASGPSSPRVDAERPSEQPRLVGLRQPFFASPQPLESPGSQIDAMEQITAQAESSGRIRVLVAEDNKVNQEVVLRMLKLEDIYDVTVAKDGQEALDLVKESMSTKSDNPQSPHAGKGPYNLIFMDVQMPNLDGLQSTKLIRDLGYRAPIVALTAFAEESNVKDCLDSGMNFFLSKPIRRPALKKVLKEYCAPIQEVDEEATTPSPPRETPRAAAQSPAKVSHERPSSRGMDMATTSHNTTVVVVSRPSSLDGGRDSPLKGRSSIDGAVRP
ncbi:hypothetical protein MBLNU457_2091t1 [Dothideomycetes sp. NU457]